VLPVFPKYPVPTTPAISAVRGGSRISAQQINKAASDPKVRTQTVAAAGALLPIIYGRCNVPGLPFFYGSIGTDLVIGYIWGVGECDAIEQVQINDLNGGSISGVTLTHYLGTTTQGVDATLVSANASYNDTMRFDVGNGWRGIAYTVARITTAAAVGGWPRARATIRGRKLYDPRTATTVYSDNPALAMGDLITDPDYGTGLTVLGLSAAADWCDTLLGGAEKRARIALTLAEGRAIDPGWLDILSVYAECGYVHEGSSIRLIPDAPVDLNLAPTIDASLIVANSLRVQAVNDIDTPTSVEIIYTPPGSATTPWPNASNSYATPGAQRIPTSIRLEGVYRSTEAGNKAKARLARLTNRVAVSFQTTDSGIVRQAGDVVNIASTARGVTLPLRIESVSYAGPGRYNVSGLRYDADHYPADLVLPSGYGTLPDAAILLFDATTLPDGYADFTAANGKFIMGAGGTYAAGATGGAAATGTWSGTTSTSGAHTGSGTFLAPDYGTAISRRSATDVADTSANHSHSWSAAAATMNLLRRRHRLAKRAGTSATIPASMLVFGIQGLSHPDVARITANAGRLLMAESTTANAANAGAATQSHSATIASANMAHKHYDVFGSSHQHSAPYYDVKIPSEEMNWPHTHTLSVTLTAAIKRRKLALYGGVTDYPVLAGMIVLHEGAVPSGWALCDGTLGTPDMRDFLVEIAATGQEGVSAGNNTVAASGSSGDYGHSHWGGDGDDGPITASQLHSGTEYHNHTVSASLAYTPEWYGLKFIMCTP
jgi:hypothetical protein